MMVVCRRWQTIGFMLLPPYPLDKNNAQEAIDRYLFEIHIPSLRVTAIIGEGHISEEVCGGG
jgi:hypothetical protein